MQLLQHALKDASLEFAMLDDRATVTEVEHAVATLPVAWVETEGSYPLDDPKYGLATRTA